MPVTLNQLNIDLVMVPKEWLQGVMTHDSCTHACKTQAPAESGVTTWGGEEELMELKSPDAEVLLQ